MSIQVPAINVNSDTFLTLFTRVNNMIDILAANAVTLDSSSNGSLTTGNGYANGILAGLVLAANTLRGGNVQSANVLYISSNASLGNSTVNVVTTTTGTILISGNQIANSTQVGLGSAYFAPSLMFLGNSTVNTVVNSSSLAFNGVVALNQLGYTVGNVSISGAAITVGNSTVNTVVGSAFITMGPGTMVINTGWVGVGTSWMNNTQIGVGGNVTMTPSEFFVGNSSTNSYLTQFGLYVAAGQVYLGYSGSSVALDLGSNVVVNTTNFFVGNSTVYQILNSTSTQVIGGAATTTQNGAGFYVGISSLQGTSLTVGSNVVVNSSMIYIGNSTVYTYHTSTGINFNGTQSILGVAANSDVQAATSSTLAVTPAALLGAMAFFTITYAATITINHQQGTNQTATLTGNPAFAAPTNARVGWPLNVIITQDATGGRVPTWNAAFDFADYGTPSGSTGANQSDLYTFLCTGSAKFAFLGIRRNI